MRTIAVVGLKGGGGKSTLTSHIAIGLQLRDRKVAVLDLDRQNSTYNVLEFRNTLNKNQISCDRLVNWSDIEQEDFVNRYIEKAKSDNIECFIIDTPAGGEDILTKVVKLADICLFIVRPTFLDLIAVASTLEQIRPLRKMCLAVLNQAPPTRGEQEATAVRKAREVLSLLKVAVAPTTIGTRLVYQQCLERGISVEEADQRDPANSEMAALIGFIDRFVFGRSAPRMDKATPPARRPEMAEVGSGPRPVSSDGVD